MTAKPIKERIKEALQEMGAESIWQKKNKMIIMVIYDISDNKLRDQVAKYLLARGLYRIQYSSFLGVVDRSKIKLLRRTLISLQPVLGPNDSIIMIPLTHQTLQQMLIVGKHIDLGFITGSSHTIII